MDEWEGRERLKYRRGDFLSGLSTMVSANSRAHDSSKAAFVLSFPSHTTHTTPLYHPSPPLCSSPRQLYSVFSLPDTAAVVKQREKRERERERVGLDRGKENKKRRGDSGKRGLAGAVIYPE